MVCLIVSTGRSDKTKQKTRVAHHIVRCCGLLPRLQRSVTVGPPDMYRYVFFSISFPRFVARVKVYRNVRKTVDYTWTSALSVHLLALFRKQKKNATFTKVGMLDVSFWNRSQPYLYHIFYQIYVWRNYWNTKSDDFTKIKNNFFNDNSILLLLNY